MLLGWLWTTWSAAQAAGPADQLKGVRARTDELRRQLSEAEAARESAVEALRKSEVAVGRSSRKLYDLESRRAGMRQRLRALDSERRQIESAGAREIDRLELLLREAWRWQGSPGVPEPANERAADAHARSLRHLGYVYAARSAHVAALHSDSQRLRTLADQAAEQAGALAELEAEQMREREALLKEKGAREGALARLASEIGRQRQALDALKRDEERLAQLVRKLEAQAAARAQAKEKARNKSKPARHAKPGKGRDQTVERDLPAPAIDSPAAVEGTDFARLKGRLATPLRGELAGRFGSPRDTGASWKGLFIRSPEGAPVHAIADGRVVFADWLRGYGNLLILDHGEGFMSLYGNNESLLREVGQNVTAGAEIAVAGASGGNRESGLYFEMRFRGKPIDPAAWVRLHQQADAD